MANLLTDSLLLASVSSTIMIRRGRSRETVIAVGSSASVLIQTGRFTVRRRDGAVEAGGAGEERLDGVVVAIEEGG